MKLSVSLLLFGCLAWTSFAYPTRDSTRTGEPLDSSEGVPDNPAVLVDPEGQDEPINLPTEEPSPVVKENSKMNGLERYVELEESQGQETQNPERNRPQRSAGIEHGQTQETQFTTEQPWSESSESREQNPEASRPQRSPGMEQGRTQEMPSMTEQPSRESEEEHPESSRPIRSAENKPGQSHAVESTTGQPTQESTESGGMQKPEGSRQRRSPQSSFTHHQETSTEQPSLETTEGEQLPELTTSSPESLPESRESVGMPEGIRQRRSPQSSFTHHQETSTEQPSLETTEGEQLPELNTSSPESLPESRESVGMPEGSRQRRSPQSSFTRHEETSTEEPSLETSESEQLPELTTSSPESLPESVESIGMPEGSRQRRHDQIGAEEQQETTTAISGEPVTRPKSHFWQALF